MLGIKRPEIGLWQLAEDNYSAGQMVEGAITNVTHFGAFAAVEQGPEGLIRVSDVMYREGQIPVAYYGKARTCLPASSSLLLDAGELD